MPRAAARAKRRGKTRRGCWRWLRVLGLLTLLALAVAAAAAWYGWNRYQRALVEPWAAFSGEGITVDITSGTSATAILVQLEREGVLADAEVARLYLTRVLHDPPLLAGEYRFERPASGREVLDRLIRGDVLLHRVTLVEGLSLEEAAAALAEAGFGDHGKLLAAMRSPAAIADLDPEAEDLEGYLFPNTYSFAKGASEREVVERLVATFRARWANEVAPRAEAAGHGRSVRETVILASIVEKEARLPAERGVIAGVYHNRLQRGIGLYADPTVIYGLKRLGRWEGRIRKIDLQTETPWNTYKIRGLPPTPIASPGLASLLAAAEPADVPYLYFVSRNDGSHVFTRTLAEHNREVDRWQRRRGARPGPEPAPTKATP